MTPAAAIIEAMAMRNQMRVVDEPLLFDVDEAADGVVVSNGTDPGHTGC